MNHQPEISIAMGKSILLRDRIPSDVEAFLSMQVSGEWRRYDAPWEGLRASLSPEEEEQYRLTFMERCKEDQPFPRQFAVIATLAGQPVGAVSRYTQHVHDHAWFIGINIFADHLLNRGLGTEALQLWIDYLFNNSEIHRIGLDTWSFNSRMIRVAKKLGFTYERAQREMHLWQDQWLDWVHFGLLRAEWEKMRSGGKNGT